MSSMLKKPGLGAFKPKAPVARRRPTAASASQGPERSATTERQSKTPAPASIVTSVQEIPSNSLNPIPEQSTPAGTVPSVELRVAEPSKASDASNEKVVGKPPNAPFQQATEAVDVNEAIGSSTVPIDPVLQTPTRATRATKSKAPLKGKATAAEARTLPTTTKKHSEANIRAVTTNSNIVIEPTTSTSQAITSDETAPIIEPTSVTVESVYPDPETSNASSAPQAIAQAPTPTALEAGTSASADTALPSVESGSQPAAAPKRARKRRAPAAETEGEPQPKKPRKPRAPRAPRAAAEPGEAAVEGENAGPAPKKRGRKRKADTENNEDGGESEPKKTRRKRSVTPEDAEEQLVDPSQMTMGDLTKDLRIGRKFSRHDELRQRVKDKRSRQRLIKLGRLPAEDQSQNGGSNAGTPAPGANGGDGTPVDTDGRASEAGPAADGVQYRIIDGQIVVDTRSLVVDRQARAAAENRNLEEIEENDFTRPTTSATYMKPHKVGPNHWTDAETELFYEFLRKFGTDFNIIAAMFGGKKTRREVKLKFNREERYCPRRINACIVGKKEWHMDMDEIKNHTGREFEEAKDIEEELARLAAAHEAEEKRAEEEIAETARQKREALFGNKKSHRAANEPAKGREAPGKENEAVAGGEEADIDIQDMAQHQPGKAKSRGRGRGKRGYGKAAQPMASGFGV